MVPVPWLLHSSLWRLHNYLFQTAGHRKENQLEWQQCMECMEAGSNSPQSPNESKNKYFSLYCYISFTKVISYQSVGIKLEIITIRVPANRKTTRDESNCFEVYSTSLELLVPDDSLQFAGLVISFQNSKVIAILFVNHRIQFGHFHMSLNQQTNFQGTAKTYFLRDTLVPENFLNFQPGQLISSNSIGWI